MLLFVSLSSASDNKVSRVSKEVLAPVALLLGVDRGFALLLLLAGVVVLSISVRMPLSIPAFGQK